MRPALALVAGAAAAAFGAVILGEYQLTGLTGVIAGALFGLAISELVLTAGSSEWRGRETLGMVGVAVFTVAGLVWACWISAGHLWRYVPKGAWTGVAVGAAVGPWWLRSGVARLRARDLAESGPEG
jgi:hypothetical protein